MTRWQHANDGELPLSAKAVAGSKASPQGRKTTRGRRLPWQSAAAVIGLLSVAAWVLIAILVRHML